MHEDVDVFAHRWTELHVAVEDAVVYPVAKRKAWQLASLFERETGAAFWLERAVKSTGRQIIRC